jgi:hypothetical protein
MGDFLCFLAGVVFLRVSREGVEDRKGRTEEVEEQRALYTWAKRRGGALPDRPGARPEGAAHRHPQRSHSKKG